MPDEIQYPSGWSPDHVNAMRALFARARAEDLWFFHNSMAVGPMWFSPDQLEGAAARGEVSMERRELESAPAV